MPEIPKLNNCCFVATLETGAKIIGFLGAILNFISFIITLVDLVRLAGHSGQDGVATAMAEHVIILITAVFGFIVAFCLLWGVYKKNPSLVRLWVIINTVLLVLNVLSLIIGIFIPGAAIADSIIRIVVGVYCILVVYSYYREETGK